MIYLLAFGTKQHSMYLTTKPSVKWRKNYPSIHQENRTTLDVLNTMCLADNVARISNTFIHMRSVEVSEFPPSLSGTHLCSPTQHSAREQGMFWHYPSPSAWLRKGGAYYSSIAGKQQSTPLPFTKHTHTCIDLSLRLVLSASGGSALEFVL